MPTWNRSPLSALKILIRADATASVGTGHVMRALALAQGLSDLGHLVALVVAELPDHLRGRFATERVQMSWVRASDSRDDALQTVKLARQFDADWVIADGYQFDTAWQQTVVDSGVLLCVIDDYAHLRNYPAHIVMNPNAYASPALYSGKHPEDGLLLGSRYVALRREFRRQQPRDSKDGSAVGNRVLVTMGGVDADGVAPTVASILAASREWRVTVIVGTSTIARRLADSVANLPGIRLVANPPDMAALMAQADLAVSAGGTTVWELAFMGVPSVLLELADNQYLVVREADRAGIGFGLGRPTAERLARIPELLARLRRDEELYRAMSSRGRDLVDGQGAIRLGDALCDAARLLRQ